MSIYTDRLYDIHRYRYISGSAVVVVVIVAMMPVGVEVYGLSNAMHFI